MAMKAPCKGCPDRTTGDREADCHTTCERYAEFQAELAQIRKARKAYEFATGLATEGHMRLKKYPPSGANKRPWHRQTVKKALVSASRRGRGNNRPARRTRPGAAKRRENGED